MCDDGQLNGQRPENVLDKSLPSNLYASSDHLKLRALSACLDALDDADIVQIRHIVKLLLQEHIEQLEMSLRD